MMNINLTWDLFIIVFFTVIIAYSFIIGKNKTIKLIIASYLALLTADGVGNLLYKYVFLPSPFLKIFNQYTSDRLMILIKVLTFIFAIVLISVKGGFEVDTALEKKGFFRAASTFIFGFLNAGLITSTILVFTSGGSFVGGGVNLISSANFAIYNESQLVEIMINNYNLWFTMPALGFLFVSILYAGEKE